LDDLVKKFSGDVCVARADAESAQAITANDAQFAVETDDARRNRFKNFIIQAPLVRQPRCHCPPLPRSCLFDIPGRISPVGLPINNTVIRAKITNIYYLELFAGSAGILPANASHALKTLVNYKVEFD
jgi:hypothetical protein